jgi:hypothetical protein
MTWWYDLAVRVEAAGLGWFCHRSAPGIDGLDMHPAHRRMVDALWKKNLAASRRTNSRQGATHDGDNDGDSRA